MKLSLSGITELTGNLDRLRDTIKKGLKPELEKAGQWYMDFLQNDVFGTEGGVYGTGWTPVNARYAKSKAARHPGRGILERTGKLKRSWSLRATSDYAVIWNYAKNENGDLYGIYHQQGTGRLPQRTIVKLDQQRQTRIYQIVKEGISNRIQAAFT